MVIDTIFQTISAYLPFRNNGDKKGCEERRVPWAAIEFYRFYGERIDIIEHYVADNDLSLDEVRCLENLAQQLRERRREMEDEHPGLPIICP